MAARAGRGAVIVGRYGAVHVRATGVYLGDVARTAGGWGAWVAQGHPHYAGRFVPPQVGPDATFGTRRAACAHLIAAGAGGAR